MLNDVPVSDLYYLARKASPPGQFVYLCMKAYLEIQEVHCDAARRVMEAFGIEPEEWTFQINKQGVVKNFFYRDVGEKGHKEIDKKFIKKLRKASGRLKRLQRFNVFLMEKMVESTGYKGEEPDLKKHVPITIPVVDEALLLVIGSDWVGNRAVLDKMGFLPVSREYSKKLIARTSDVLEGKEIDGAVPVL